MIHLKAPFLGAFVFITTMLNLGIVWFTINIGLIGVLLSHL